MKKLFFLITSILIFTGCEDVVQVDLASDTGRLVIDARLERIYDVTGEIHNDVAVNLSLTTSFYNPFPNYVNDAQVSITDLNSETVYNLDRIDNSGFYAIPTSANFEIQNDIEYKLTVIYNGETYEAIEVLNVSVPIDSALQFRASEEIVEPEDVAINVTYTDIEGTENYYFFGFNNTNFLATDDDFTIDGDEFTFNYFYEDPKSQTMIIFLYGSNKRTNNYVDSVEELSEGGSNGPFSTVPYEIKGNIVNVSNSSNYPYGYFRVNEVYFTKINLVENENAPSLSEVEILIEQTKS